MRDTSLGRCGAVMAGLLGLVIMGGCGEDGEPGSAASSTTRTSHEAVKETREITDDELANLSDDDGNTPLSCEDVGGATWDYGDMTDSEGGREPIDSLEAAIADLNRDESAARLIPTTGWVELMVDETDRVFVLEDEAGSFTAAVMVSGDPALGVWRHQEAYVCPAARE